MKNKIRTFGQQTPYKHQCHQSLLFTSCEAQQGAQNRARGGWSPGCKWTEMPSYKYADVFLHLLWQSQDGRCDAGTLLGLFSNYNQILLLFQCHYQRHSHVCLLLNATGPANYSGHKGTPQAEGKQFQSQERLLQMVGTTLTPSQSRGGTHCRMLCWFLDASISTPQGVLAASLQMLFPCPHLPVPSCLQALLYLWIQRQDLKENVLKHFQNPKINDTCHYKMTC